ncbi:uncharacterized protein [Anabrus simplex]|uniref:uncharacterized protein n=1 Tax=Anabrus simplex TaxID=316456 RepID=UPI0035A3D5EF
MRVETFHTKFLSKEGPDFMMPGVPQYITKRTKSKDVNQCFFLPKASTAEDTTQRSVRNNSVSKLSLRINVTKFGDKSQCANSVQSQKYYIVFAERRDGELSAKYDDLFGATIDWSEDNEDLVWTGVGWEPWSDWSACSASCGEGTQERRRFCRQKGDCQGYNKERRRCNIFSCEGAVDPLSLEDRRYFHPSRAQWEHVPARPSAWRLRPNSYIWVPSSELFPVKETNKAGSFPREFTLLVTLRLHQQGRAQGTVFSLRSRRQQDAYLSVELGGADSIKVVHAGPNGTQTVEIPAPLADGNWHQIALGFHDDSSVRSYMDCAWVSTDILKRNALDTPEDADIVIGYLFVGDLEQLVIVPTPTAVRQQCSASKVPLLDPDLLQLPAPSENRPRERRGRRTKGRKGVEYRHDNQYQSAIPPPPLPPLEQQDGAEEGFEGSGSEGGSPTDGQYEVEWSEWSACSASCGTGSQSRYSRCVDDGSRLELCMEAGGERTETRACSHGVCPPSNYTSSAVNISHAGRKQPHKHHKQPHKYKNLNTTNSASVNGSGWSEGLVKQCSCLNGGICNHKRRTCHCPAGYFGRRCERVSCHPPCQNGGRCEQVDKCECTPEYTGPHCEEPVCPGGCSNGGLCVAPGRCSCPGGFSGPLCRDGICSGSCLNGGRCLPGGGCACPEGWTGPDCGASICDPPCRFGGQCIKPHTCHCPAGTSGQYCQDFSCRQPCLNGGACVGPDVCECPHNASGPLCEQPVCDPPCENGATCMAGNRCLCDPTSTGTRCEKRKCDYRPYQEPYTRGFRRLVNRQYETKCNTGSWKSCVRTQPEYQTVYKTFYRTVYKCEDDHH